MPFWWNPRLVRYQDRETGRIVAYQSILRDVNDSISAAITAPAVTEDGVLSAGADTLANLTANGLLSPQDFTDLFRGELKREYIRQYTLGVGGRDQMTPSDWGKLGSMLKPQYKYLDGFTDALLTGDLTEAQIKNRATMYINSSRDAFNTAHLKARIEAGYNEVLWVLNPPAENCKGCEDNADLGWQKIEDDPYDGAVPGSGDTPCLSNCQCHLEYRIRKGE